MLNHSLKLIVLIGLVALSACGTIATPMPAPPPTSTPIPTMPIDPSTAQIGRWQWLQFITEAETYPPVQLWLDVSDGGAVQGELAIYPNYTTIPTSALTLIQQNGCITRIGGLQTDMVNGYFYAPTEAAVVVNITECTVKYYGTVPLEIPLQGTFILAYNDALTQAILNPITVELTPIERGRRVFLQYCSGCHGSYAEGSPGIPSLHTDQVSGYNDEQLRTILRLGVAGTTMPAWGNVLSPEDFEGVFTLVRNIAILEQ